jgi:hypothetical protein
MQSVADQLQRERRRLAIELNAVTAALKAFGKVYASSSKSGPTVIRKKRTMSAAGRNRIAAAQRARWAKVKRAGKKQPMTAKALKSKTK